MKTPRELLLERHRSAGAKLDDVRRAAVAIAGARAVTAAPEDGRTPAHERATRSLAGMFRDALLSLRWHLAGITVAWIAVALLNVDTSGSTGPATSSGKPAEQLVTSLRENRRQLSEAMEITPQPTNAAPTAEPQRRGDRQRWEAMA
jgi:hypothetical protein